MGMEISRFRKTCDPAQLTGSELPVRQIGFWPKAECRLCGRFGSNAVTMNLGICGMKQRGDILNPATSDL